MKLDASINSFQDVFEFVLFKTSMFSFKVYHIIFFLLLWAAVWLILKMVRRLLNSRAIAEKMDESSRYVIFVITKYFIIVLGIAIAFESVGIRLTLLLAGSTALFVGIGLGVQDVFKDIISGFILLFGRTIRVGDIIEVDGVVGRVGEIGLRASHLTSRADIDMIIPNSKFINNSVINWSYGNKLTRFSVDIGVAYGSDTRKVEEILLQIAVELDQIATSPSPFVRFADFGDSSLDFQLFFWSEEIFRIEHIKSDIRYLIDDAFRRQNIVVPFPQRDIHLFPRKK